MKKQKEYEIDKNVSYRATLQNNDFQRFVYENTIKPNSVTVNCNRALLHGGTMQEILDFCIAYEQELMKADKNKKKICFHSLSYLNGHIRNLMARGFVFDCCADYIQLVSHK